MDKTKAPKKKKPAAKKAPKKPVLTLINLKVTEAERARLKANALKYTGGNVGALIRLVAADPKLKLRKAA